MQHFNNYGGTLMSIIIFIVVTILSVYALPFLGDEYSTGISILVGLGAAIWYKLTEDEWHKEK